MSEWRPDSEVSGVNLAAGVAPAPVSLETYEVIRQAVELSELTHGAFDVTWAALRGVWDFKARPPRLPNPETIRACLARTGWHKIELDPDNLTVFLPELAMAIGLGGIAKGYAIDRASAVLRRHGLSHFIVDGGGDLFVAGVKAPQTHWRLGIQNPRQRDDLLAALRVRDVALVTSGDYERGFVLDGRRYHHIIDLRTGYPAELSMGVTVLAPTAALADALATALFVLGPIEGIVVAGELEGVEAAIVEPDGNLATTPGMLARLESVDP